MTTLPALPQRRARCTRLNNQPICCSSLTSLFWAANIVLARHHRQPCAAGHPDHDPLVSACS